MTNPARPRLAILRMAAATTMLLLCAGSHAAGPEPAPAAGAPPSLAPELAQLREQIAQLRQTLERLDGRLQQLEKTPPAAQAPRGADAAPPAAAVAIPQPAVSAAPAQAPLATPATTASGALDAHQQAVLKEQVRTTDALNSWREVRTGMRQEDVRHLLGEPQSTLDVGNRKGWIYTYRNAGKGSIFFDRDGVVVSLISPSQGAVHLY